MSMLPRVNKRRCSEENGHWLEKVDQTQLVLASDKLVLQKSYHIPGSQKPTGVGLNPFVSDLMREKGY